MAYAASAELVLITHPGNSTSQLSLEDAKKIFLGQATEYPGGAKAIPMDQKDGTPAKTEFLTKVLQKDSGQVKAIWSKLIFTGGMIPPVALGSDAEVKNKVANTKGSLGYVSKGAEDSSVKVLLVVP